MDIEGGLIVENSFYIPFLHFGKTACELTIVPFFEMIQGFLFAAYKQGQKL